MFIPITQQNCFFIVLFFFFQSIEKIHTIILDKIIQKEKQLERNSFFFFKITLAGS